MQYLFLGQFDVVFCLKTLDSIAARQCSCPALFEIFGIFFFYNCFLSWTICRCFINYILLFLLNTIHNVAAGPWSYQTRNLAYILLHFFPIVNKFSLFYQLYAPAFAKNQFKTLQLDNVVTQRFFVRFLAYFSSSIFLPYEQFVAVLSTICPCFC